MSGKRRRIRPHERARVDQTLAEARERALREPHTLVAVCEYADPGVQCCWCDCTVEDHMLHGNCDGCARYARFMHHILVRTEHITYPVCKHHQADFVEFHTKRTGGDPIPLEWHVYDAYDKDAHDE